MTTYVLDQENCRVLRRRRFRRRSLIFVDGWRHALELTPTPFAAFSHIIAVAALARPSARSVTDASLFFRLICHYSNAFDALSRQLLSDLGHREDAIHRLFHRSWQQHRLLQDLCRSSGPWRRTAARIGQDAEWKSRVPSPRLRIRAGSVNAPGRSRHASPPI